MRFDRGNLAMSNHSGGYMLNSLLKLLDRYHFFNEIGIEKKQEFFEEIWRINCDHDCNAYEILEDLGEKLGICDGCFALLKNGRCHNCKST